jgi:hypothetical protein
MRREESSMNLHQAAALPEKFRRIQLQLAREADHPEGESGIGYTVLAPLDEDGRLDIDLARRFREHCKVVRFHTDEASKTGYLRRRPGGSWAFHYRLEDGEDDDPGFKLGEHRFAPGEYITIAEDEGEHTYRVIWVRET